MFPQSLAAQNDTTAPIKLVGVPTSPVVAICTSSDTVAGAVVVVEVELIPDQWIAIGIFNAITQTKVDNITGPSQYGWTDTPTAQRARGRRTDAAGGTCKVGIEQVNA